jgi:hypothetical protein
MTIVAPPTEFKVSKMFKEPASTVWPEKNNARKTFGFWFYGIVFLMSSLIGLIILVSLVRNILVITKVMGVGSIPSSKILLTAIFATMTFVLFLLSISILSRKNRGLILAICSLLILWGILGKICCVYFIPLSHVISGPNSAIEVVFLASTLLFFMRPKIKNQFRQNFMG